MARAATEHEATAARWAKQCQALHDQVDELGRSLLGVVGKHRDVSATLETRSAQVAALKAELAEARGAEAELENEAAVAHRKAERALGDAESLRVDVSRLKREVRSAREALDDLPAPPPQRPPVVPLLSVRSCNALAWGT